MQPFPLNISASVFVPKQTPALNPQAKSFSFSVEATSFQPKPTFSLPKQEKPKSPSPPVQEQKISPFKVYSTELLLSLRESKPVRQFQYTIPDQYHINKKPRGKKGKFPSNDSFKRSRNPLQTSKMLVPSQNPYINTLNVQKSDFLTNQGKIRETLNKLSQANFQKLGLKLVNQFVYDKPLLGALVKLIFERATAFNFPELYAQLCGFLRKKFKQTSEEMGKNFRIQLIQLCHRCFYQSDQPLQGTVVMDIQAAKKRRLIGNIKFVGLLFKQKMLRASIMYECFDVLLKDISDQNVETFCLLFNECANILSAKDTIRLEEYFNRVAPLHTSELLSRRIRFKIQDLIDKRDSFFRPIGRNSLYSPVKPVQNRFKLEEPSSPVKKNPNALKSSSKEGIHRAIRGFFSDYDLETSADQLRVILNEQSEGLCIGQVFKFALTDFHQEEHFKQLCSLLRILFTDTKCVTRRGITEGVQIAVERISDIRLDAPHSPRLLSLCVNLLKDLLNKNPNQFLSRLAN